MILAESIDKLLHIQQIIIYFAKMTFMKSTDKNIRKNVFQQILEDKRAIRECIQNGGNIEKVAKERGIKFATPL